MVIFHGKMLVHQRVEADRSGSSHVLEDLAIATSSRCVVSVWPVHRPMQLAPGCTSTEYCTESQQERFRKSYEGVLIIIDLLLFNLYVSDSQKSKRSRARNYSL